MAAKKSAAKKSSIGTDAAVKAIEAVASKVEDEKVNAAIRKMAERLPVIVARAEKRANHEATKAARIEARRVKLAERLAKTQAQLDDLE